MVSLGDAALGRPHLRRCKAHCGGEEERPAAVQRPSGMKNMGQALYLLHLRQREQLVGALSEWQQLHEFLQCQQQRQRQLQQREQREWRGLRILQRWVRTVTGSGEAAPLQKESLFPAQPKQSSDAVSRTLLAWRANVRTARSMAGTATRIEHAPKNNSVQGMP